MRNPGLSEDLTTEPLFELLALVLKIKPGKRGFGGDFESVSRRAKPHNRSTALEVVGDRLHLLVGKVLKP